jgi:hypothetical protein
MSKCPYCNQELTSGGCPNRCQEQRNLSAMALGGIQYHPPSNPRCECHQCTWLRASQMERATIPPLASIVIKSGEESK